VLLLSVCNVVLYATGIADFELNPAGRIQKMMTYVVDMITNDE
jgi:hypothetical protein